MYFFLDEKSEFISEFVKDKTFTFSFKILMSIKFLSSNVALVIFPLFL